LAVAEKKAYLLRVDATLHEALQKWAADELRSVNGQIEFVLRRALQDAGRLPTGPPPARPTRARKA
jgi:hypothetical protein